MADRALALTTAFQRVGQRKYKELGVGGLEVGFQVSCLLKNFHRSFFTILLIPVG
jgi:hypothetical protein